LIKNELNYLANDRRQFLDQAYKTEDAYLHALIELDFAQRSLHEVTEQYDTFLAERLLWISSTRAISLSSIYIVPGQLQELLAAKHWRNIVTTLYEQATSKLWMAFTLIIVGILLWRNRDIRKKLIATGDNVGNVMSDKISFTAWGLLLTLLLAVAWPLLMASIGWQLVSALESSSFTKNVGHGLILTSQALFFLRAYHILCMKGGIAERHFKWPDTSIRLLRRDIDIFIYTFLPPGFIALIAINSDIPGHNEGLGRFAFIIASLALALFFYRVLNPAAGALCEFSLRQKKPAMTGIRYLWLLIAIVIPIGSAILALLGYLYSASTLLENLIQSLWLILELVILHQFVVRWLLIARRRLALQAACEKQDLMQAMREKSKVTAREDTLDLEKPTIDINALSDDIHKLLNTSLVILAAFMLWASWSNILPAFHIFDQITLWQNTVNVAGETRHIPITLIDAALAVVTIIILLIFVKRLPAFVEILLRQRSTITPGSLYATKLLISYSVVAVGVVMVFSRLGGTWSEIQWVFAALGIGIGFGLQEIVANFISGLVILFERPIRVGDVVTVGDINGVVTRIRIRATTIRDFDHKELLVPNKEFINSQLLNWSLSDDLIRLMVTVSIDYGNDVKLAKRLMEEAALESKYTIGEPAPFVTLESFDEQALTLVLRYLIDNIDYRLLSINDLHETIYEKFKEADISVSFPKRDVHIKMTQPLDLGIQREKKRAGQIDLAASQ
jgi:potassium efflux system protein